MVSGSVTPSKVAQPRVATQSEFFDEASPSNRILNVEGSRSISSTEGVAQGGDSFSGDLVPEISKHGASNSSGSPVRSEVASGADRTEVATVPQLRLDDLSLTERPVRALIIEQVDAMMDRSAAARHRLFKDAIWAAHPVAVLIPPALGWVEASKGRSQCIDELKQQGLEWIDEIEVLTHQSAINFEFWTGYEPELDSIRESLEEYLQW
jgi:hypothetical protein